MTLRSKLLALFGALAIVPLLAISVFDYWRSANSIRRLLEAQTAAVAGRVAAQSAERYEVIEGDLALLANNAETRRLLETGKGREDAQKFLESALPIVGWSVEAISVRDSAERELIRLALPDSTLTPETRSAPRSAFEQTWLVTLPIATDDGTRLGSLVATIRVEAIVPALVLNDRVGIAGSTTITHDSLAQAGTLIERDTLWVETIVPIGKSGLAISSAAALVEFGQPLGKIWMTNLVLAVVVTAALALAFLVIARRLSGPVESLTAAAEQIGRGNFAPALPASGNDEVGRLADAIRRMIAQVEAMMRQIESSRQMAAVGAFSAKIAHEIRNPLTSIKLNLQSLARELSDGRMSPSARRPLEICMEEIQRLDKVVRGVLQLGSTQLGNAERISVHETLNAAADLTRAQLELHNVTLELACAAPRDEVLGDRDRLRGVLLNLILNAVDALPDGGHIRASTAIVESGDVPLLQVRVSDSGPGVIAKDRDSIFEPFYTTKPNGSGLGLAVASRDVEGHRGRLSLMDRPGELGGATFVIELPLAGRDA